MVVVAQDALILLLHPLAALAVIYLMYDQHRWRKQRLELRGEERLAARAGHEQRGERLFQAAVAVVLLGFAVSLFRGLSAGETLFWALLPNHYHGFLGPLALGLFAFLRRKGQMVRDQREAGEKFALELQRHGRASDVIIILMLFHAFLGFLYLLQLLR